MTDELDPKTKYVLHYATDVSKPPGVSPSKMVQFRSWPRFAFFALTNKEARSAVIAGRCRLLNITK